MNKNPGRRQRRWAERQAKRQDGKIPNLGVPPGPVYPSLEKRRITPRAEDGRTAVTTRVEIRSAEVEPMS
jgi:hypothetical protein